jgi:hypothetical protein
MSSKDVFAVESKQRLLNIACLLNMRPFLIFVLSVFFASAVSAQSKLAISAGGSYVLNRKAIYQTNYPEPKLPLGFSASMWFLLNSEKRISFIAKTGFIRKGFLRASSGDPDNQLYTAVKVGYLYLNPQASIRITNSSKSNLYFSTGPYAAVAVTGKEQGDWITIAGPRPYNGHAGIGTSKVNDLNGAKIDMTDAGIGSSLFYQFKHYGVMLNWQQGLKNIVLDIPYSNSAKSYKNSTLDLVFFYQFNLSKQKKNVK